MDRPSPRKTRGVRVGWHSPVVPYGLMEAHQLNRWIDDLVAARNILERHVSRGGGVALPVGADPLSMERDPELQDAVELLSAVINKMRQAIFAESISE